MAYGVLSDEAKRKDYDDKIGVRHRIFRDMHGRPVPSQRSQAQTYAGYGRFRTKPYKPRAPWENPYRSTEEIHRKYQEAMRSV